MGGDEPARTLVAAALGDGQAGRDREQARASPSTGRSSSGRARGRGRAAVRGGGRRAASPCSVRSRSDLAGEPDRPGPRDRQRHDELHPDGDGARGARLRRGARRGAGARVRRGRPDRRRRRRSTPSTSSSSWPGSRSAHWIDPADDREPAGHDAGAAGRPASPASPRSDVARAGGRGTAIRLIATRGSRRTARSRRRSCPPPCRPASAFGRCDGVLNRVEVDAVPLGRVGVRGPGRRRAPRRRRRCSATWSRSRAGWARPGPGRLPPATLDPLAPRRLRATVRVPNASRRRPARCYPSAD